MTSPPPFAMARKMSVVRERIVTAPFTLPCVGEPALTSEEPALPQFAWYADPQQLPGLPMCPPMQASVSNICGVCSVPSARTKP